MSIQHEVQNEAIIINMNEVILNSNVETIYSNYFLNIPFKLIDNTLMSTTLTYAIKYASNMDNFIRCMREKIKNDFKLSTEFEIIINTERETGLNIYDYIKQLFNNRDLKYIAVCEVINKSTGFYVRPKYNQQSNNACENSNQSEQSDSQSQMSIHNINDCPVCFASLEHIRSNYFVCRHHICHNCFINWRNRNGNETNCPICRSQLNII